MKLVLRYTACAILCFFLSGKTAKVYSQNFTLDSLVKVLNNYSDTDTARAGTLNAIALEHCSKSPDKAMEYAIEALSIAKSLDYKKGIAEAYTNLGFAFRYQNSFREALENFNQSLEIRKEIGLQQDIAATYENIGNVHFLQGNYPEAVLNYQESLKISEETGDKKRGAKTSNNLGLVYMTQSNYADALKYHLKSLKLKEEIQKEHPDDSGNKKGIASSYNNIGSIYMYEQNFEEALEYYFKSLQIRQDLKDKKGLAEVYNNIGSVYTQQKNYSKALDYNNNALALKQELGDKKGMATTYTNIGTIYEKEGNFEEALKYHVESLRFNRESSNKNGVATSYFNIGSTYKSLKMYNQSSENLNKSLELAKELGAKRIIQECYEGLSEVNYTLKNFDRAYDYHKLFSDIKDSIFNETKANQIAELGTKYESEKKQKEIELLTKQNELSELKNHRNQIAIYSVGGGLGLVLILALVSLNAYRQKRKDNKLLEFQNKEISLQKLIIETKNKDITDSIVYAKRIQQAILPPDSSLSNAFPEHFILFKPKDIVSGDFYWYTEFNPKDSENNPLRFIAAVDCTGHGVPGAFMSIIGHTALNQAVNESGITTPSEILEEVNKILSETLRSNLQESEVKDGMDIALCCFDLKNMIIQYSGAYNPLWVIKSKNGSYSVSADIILEDITEIKADKHPIGSFVDGEEFKKFTNHEIKLQKGDTVYIFSDGYSDQFGGPNGKKFKPKQFKETLLQIQDKPMKEQKVILEKNIEQWRGSLEQIDDILVIGVRV